MDSSKYEIDEFTGEIRQTMSAEGHEIPDPTPVAIPAQFKRPETLQEQIRRLVRSERFNAEVEAQGGETFDEADDFDVDDDFDPSTPYETFFDPLLNREVTPHEFEKFAEGYKKRYAAATKEYFNKIDEDNIIAENLVRRRYKEPPKKGGGEGEPSPSKPPLPGGDSP